MRPYTPGSLAQVIDLTVKRRAMDTTVTPHPDQFAAWLRSRSLSPKTVGQYRRVMARAQELLGGDLRTVTATQVGDYLAAFDGWTRSSYQNALSSAFDWLELTGEIDANPLRRADKREAVKRPPKPDDDPHPLAPVEETAVLRASTGDLRAWLLLGLRQGLRCHEIAKFRGEDIEGKRLRVNGKGGKLVRLPLHPEIDTLADQYPREGYWFPSARATSGHITPGWITGQVASLFRIHGLSGSIHRARHTYATSLLLNGADLETVRQLMRHSSLATTQRYLRVMDDRLAAAINTLGGAA